MSTFTFKRLADGQYRTTVTSDAATMKQLVELLTDAKYETTSRLARRRAEQIERAERAAARGRHPAGGSAAQVEDDRPVLAAVHVEAVPDGDLARHARDLIEAAAETRRRAGEGDDGAGRDEGLLQDVVADVADQGVQPAGGSVSQGSGQAEGDGGGMRAPVRGQRGHDVDAVRCDGGASVDGHVHGGAPSAGCRCAGAARSDGAGVAQPTEAVGLGRVVELLERVVADLGRADIAVDISGTTLVGYLDGGQGQTAQPAGGEDDVEQDCEGPEADAEGVDGGEDR